MNPAAPMTIRLDRRLYMKLAADSGLFDAILDVAQTIYNIRNTDPLLERLLEEIGERIPADRSGVFLAQRGGNGPLHGAAFGASPFEADPNILSQVRRDSVAILVHAPRSILCAPLGIFDSDLGLVYLETDRPGAFDERHLENLVAISAFAAVPLHHTRDIDRLEEENQDLREYTYINHGFVGESRPILEMHERINKVAGTDSTVLILGESGTGKELVANAIHANSRRAEGPLYTIHCGALTETLLESELFGYEKGAFTGAAREKKGKVEMARGGTLFLDEIGEMPLQMQPALLRVLQTGDYQRVGGTRTLQADVRIVAATNRNLKEWVKEGRFREDLYYRLHVIPVRTPSLREIREDIPLLAKHFLQKFRFIRPVDSLSAGAQQILMQHDWPGNVREFENAIRYALIVGETNPLEADDLPESVLAAPASQAMPTGYYARLEDYGRTLLENALKDTNGNHAEAGRILGLSKGYVGRLVRKWKIRTSSAQSRLL